MAVGAAITPVFPLSLSQMVHVDYFTTLFNNLTHRYEQLFGVAAPGKSSLSFIPHDHSASRGGRVFGRNRQFSFLAATQGEFSIQEFGVIGGGGTTIPLEAIYRSTEGLRPLSQGQAFLCLRAPSGRALRIRERTNTVWTEWTSSNSNQYEWVAIPIARPVTAANFEFQSVDGNDVPIFLSGAICVEMDSQNAQTGGLQVQRVPGTLISRIITPPLNDSFITKTSGQNYWADAFLFHCAASYAMTMFEACYDIPSPGHATQTCKGHDHGTQGGAPVARGGVYSAYRGFNRYIAERTNYVLNTWTAVSPSRAYNLYPYISAGIVTTGSAPDYTPLSVDVHLEIEVVSTETLQIRIVNDTASLTSQAITLNAVGGGIGVRRVTIPRVPVTSGINKMQIQARMLTATTTMRVVQAEVYETPGRTYLPI